jgi:nucleoside-diphosphate-sugar epimerase
VLESDRAAVDREVFNVGDSNENYTKKDLVELIVAHVPHPVEIERVQKNEDPRDYRVNFDKIRERLGFRITRTVPDGIGEVASAVAEGVIGNVRDQRYRNVH